jgi:NAD(P)H-dependent FMN reductase
MKPIVTICGTSRPDNFTGKALAVVDDELRNNGASVTRIDASDLDLAFPGQPETDDAKRLRKTIEGAGSVVLATPEYHGSFCAMTKLIIENLGFPSLLAGKPMALLGVAAGRIGAIKTLEQLRGLCAHVGAIVLPGAMSVAGVRGLFDESGACSDAATEEALRGFAGTFLDFHRDYVCPKYVLEDVARDSSSGWTANV